jgi:hypothetical protein
VTCAKGEETPRLLTKEGEGMTKDKQDALEVIIDESAGKRWEEQENGEGPQPCLRAPGAKIAKEEKL